jgi:uncharacterized tellurite resistance protein B-like protein
MRSYPVNSPEAAARIIALTMLADGHLSQNELDVLHRRGGCEQLGLEPDRLHDVLLALCEDLLHGAQISWSEACKVDPHALSRLMSEIDDPALRERVLALCVQVAEADEHPSEAESLLLTHAVEQWGLRARMFQLRAAAHEPPQLHAG